MQAAPRSRSLATFSHVANAEGTRIGTVPLAGGLVGEKRPRQNLSRRGQSSVRPPIGRLLKPSEVGKRCSSSTLPVQRPGKGQPPLCRTCLRRKHLSRRLRCCAHL